MKYTVIVILMTTCFVGGFAQFITLSPTPVIYNAYLQLAIGFGLFIWLSHKVISKVEQGKPIVNARDKKIK